MGEGHHGTETPEEKQEQFRESFFVCSFFKCFTLVQPLLENTSLVVCLFLLLKKDVKTPETLKCCKGHN